MKSFRADCFRWKERRRRCFTEQWPRTRTSMRAKMPQFSRVPFKVKVSAISPICGFWWKNTEWQAMNANYTFKVLSICCLKKLNIRCRGPHWGSAKLEGDFICSLFPKMFQNDSGSHVFSGQQDVISGIKGNFTTAAEIENVSLAGVDEDVIISILVKRNNEQRQKIKVVYEATTGKVVPRFIRPFFRTPTQEKKNKKRKPRRLEYNSYFCADFTTLLLSVCRSDWNELWNLRSGPI